MNTRENIIYLQTFSVCFSSSLLPVSNLLKFILFHEKNLEKLVKSEEPVFILDKLNWCIHIYDEKIMTISSLFHEKNLEKLVKSDKNLYSFWTNWTHTVTIMKNEKNHDNILK